MQLEIHILQSFPPANLNRDENGMPKSTVFGGRPRARISSQCQKRETRLHYQKFANLDDSLFAKRSPSEHWIAELTKQLVSQGIEFEKAELASNCAMTFFTEKKEAKGKAKLKPNKKDKNDGEDQSDSNKGDTNLFLGNTEVDAIVKFILSNWQQIEQDISAKTPAFSSEIIKGFKNIIDTKLKPGDVALFGRMMANLPSGKVDAAVQVAHAISVNTLQQEFDFYTAVNELTDGEPKGAGHLGEMGFNSSTYYRFAVLDSKQLLNNLDQKIDIASKIAYEFANSFVRSVPSGHKNQCAPHSRPSAIMIVVRKDQPFSLVNAYENPIKPNYEASLVGNAIKLLDKHWKNMADIYGESLIEFKGIT